MQIKVVSWLCLTKTLERTKPPALEPSNASTWAWLFNDNNVPQKSKMSGSIRVSCHLHGCFQKYWYPQIIHFNRVFHYKPSILWYPHFWKHPHLHVIVIAVINEECKDNFQHTWRIWGKMYASYISHLIMVVSLSKIRKHLFLGGVASATRYIGEMEFSNCPTSNLFFLRKTQSVWNIKLNNPSLWTLPFIRFVHNTKALK